MTDKPVLIGGKPVKGEHDALDKTCQVYNGCLKCVHKAHDDACNGEFVNYQYGEVKGVDTCLDAVGTCERDLCMCDLAFAESHAAAKNQFNSKRWLFRGHYWDPFGKEWERSNKSITPECCQAGDKDTELIRYNSDNHTCFFPIVYFCLLFICNLSVFLLYIN